MAKETASGAKKQAAHPPYLQMITEALTALKERTGSSVPAIAKFIEQKYGSSSLPENFRKMLTLQLKNLVKSERLVKVKNSFKLTAGNKPKPKSIGATSSKKDEAAVSNKDTANKGKTKAAVGSSKSGKAAAGSSKSGKAAVGSSRSGKAAASGNKGKRKSLNAKVSEAKKVVKRAMKTKRLSLVKTPDGMKKKMKKAGAGAAKNKSKKVAKGDAPGKSTKKKPTGAAKK